jgi:alkylation response protein AidB-like acyl-CoA dehydrogenase
MDAMSVLVGVRELSEAFVQERSSRQLRRALEQADFDRLRQAGVHLAGVPVELGGLWEDAARSTRPICALLRSLAAGDASLALVMAMHPTVLSLWLTTPQAPPPFERAWDEQRRHVLGTVLDGAWWGTITSEPGSGGDVQNTRAVARRDPEGTAYRISGLKHFGSGSGMTSYMLTSAVPEGESGPDWFFLDVRDAPWDGSTGMTLLAPWDGHGMAATQSHAFRFESFPATRFAWPGGMLAMQAASGSFIGCCFTAVIVGIVETALATARQQLERRRQALRPYEQVEWSRAELEGWLVEQSFEGMLRAVERHGSDPRSATLGKTAVAELAESVLARLCRVLGGSVYARQSPFGFWFEDVRALGFLRPPWGLAYDRIFEQAFPSTDQGRQGREAGHPPGG